VSQNVMDCHENCDNLLPNGMPCHNHMEDQCCNPSLGLVTKARACEGASQK